MDEKDFVKQLLEVYLTSRSPMPDDGYVPAFRTTVQIQDELEPMIHAGGMDIVEFLYEHGYRPTADEDGSPIWAIYRRVEILE